ELGTIRSIRSAGRESDTAPRSYSGWASGCVLPFNVTRTRSSTGCVIRERDCAPVAPRPIPRARSRTTPRRTRDTRKGRKECHLGLAAMSFPKSRTLGGRVTSPCHETVQDEWGFPYQVFTRFRKRRESRGLAR